MKTITWSSLSISKDCCIVAISSALCSILAHLKNHLIKELWSRLGTVLSSFIALVDPPHLLVSSRFHKVNNFEIFGSQKLHDLWWERENPLFYIRLNESQTHFTFSKIVSCWVFSGNTSSNLNLYKSFLLFTYPSLSSLGTLNVTISSSNSVCWGIEDADGVLKF